MCRPDAQGWNKSGASTALTPFPGAKKLVILSYVFPGPFAFKITCE